MRVHDARLVPAAVGGMFACLVVGVGAVPWRPVVMVAVLVAALSTAVAVSPAKGIRVAPHIAVGVAVVALSIATLVAGTGYRLESRVAPPVREAIAAREHVELLGTVVAEARPATSDAFTGDPRWEATILASRVDGLPARARFDVVVDDPALLDLGTPVWMAGRASTSLDPRTAAVLWQAHVVQSGHADGRSSAISRLREGLREAAAGLPHEVRALTEGMVIGDDSRMAPEQVESMRRSGLAHLTAVSGAHFAVLTVVVVWATRRAKAPRAMQAVVVALVTAGFALLVGAEPSVVRAVTMALAIALAISWGRPARALPALAAGVLVLLALDPLIATSLGFQLSVVAVAAIAIWAPHLATRFARHITPGLARVMSIPVAAASATAPLLLGVAGGIGTYNVPANLIAAPFSGLVTVLGLTGTIVAPVSPQVGEWLVSGAGGAAWPVSVAARAFSSAPGAWIEWPSAPWAGLAAASIVVVAVVATMSRRVRGWSTAAALGLVLVALAAPPAIEAASAPRLPDWDIVVCDVGQGDMMMLRTAPDAAVVIDTGPRDGGAAECLARHGVRSIDLLILTHPHADHDGAVSHVLRAAPVQHAWVSPAGADAASTRALETAGVPVEVVAAPRTAALGPVRIDVLAPARGATLANDNDASVVVFASAGGARVLALGDIESTGQAALASVLRSPVVVDVVKVAHHGSADQDPDLAGKITARIGAVSVGADNSYGHPAASALELYVPRVGALLRTDLCGDVVVAAGPQFRIASRCPLHMGG